ncbi:kynurenine 3-monooxygenase isoform A [Micractinium conductrix]|uniref:Kynurenine 3-monooxygenase isoform A n=1 Tax=Micractinium conductrix TaxID=554055 RepID=A0A2P6V8F1_9CHLO|nr:kynurenine 3-monooxygenase isoform A [Micractinium conductrix]|eukprot:PSC70364.1 kynurenine 3-monooxygenase isoform A [Micractinium conductrix]
MPVPPTPNDSRRAAAPVVVVGAGPAGLLAAAFLSLAHGCDVAVFDKRGHPGPLPMPDGFEDDNDSRGVAAISAAGLDVEALVNAPGANLATIRDQVLARGDALPTADGRRGSLLTVRAERPRVIGSRQAFVRALLHLVEEEAARVAGTPCGTITFHWGASFASADLAAQAATFKLDNGEEHTEKYSLLPNRQYNVVRGLPPMPHLDLMPTPGALPGSSEAYGRLLMVAEAPAAVAAAGGGPQGNIFLSQPSAEAVTAVVTLPHARWAAAGLDGDGAPAEAYAKMLAASWPTLPAEWTAAAAQQMAERPLHETGMQVHANQLHAPGVVLLGDAAHAVSPATSNGMNGALEDALVLSEALRAVGGDLEALPAAYTAARKPDADALLWLDGALSSVAGRGGPDTAAIKAAVTARVILNKLSAGWVRPPALLLLKDGTLPYGVARRQVERETAVAKAMGAGGLAAAGAGLAALLAAPVRRWL